MDLTEIIHIQLGLQSGVTFRFSPNNNQYIYIVLLYKYNKSALY
nr:MAG TPA_asm: hypothetical protein [Caudoviricetes sp.]